MPDREDVAMISVTAQAASHPHVSAAFCNSNECKALRDTSACTVVYGHVKHDTKVQYAGSQQSYFPLSTQSCVLL